MYVLQPSLFPFDEFIALDRNDRLVLVLEALNAEPLLAKLEAERKGRRDDYPLRALWYSLIAGVVYRIPTITELVAELERNPGLRYLCGMRSAADVPRPWTYSRFLSKLVKHEQSIDAMVQELIGELGERLPDFGETIAVDATDVHAWSNPYKKRASDPDATWGVKGSKPGAGKKSSDKYYWFGYKLHLAVDTKYELPAQFHLTTASRNETTQLIPQMEEIKSKQPVIAARIKHVLADAAYDSLGNNEYVYHDLGASPLIPINPRTAEPSGITNLQGTPLCMAGKEMSYAGNDNGFLKYRAPCIVKGFECPLGIHGRCCHPNSYGTVVKMRVADNPRLTPPIPRETKKWKRLYARRTAVERVNSRLKELLLLDSLRVRGMKRVWVRTGLNILVMLAGAVAMLRQGRLDKVRSVTRLVA